MDLTRRALIAGAAATVAASSLALPTVAAELSVHPALQPKILLMPSIYHIHRQRELREENTITTIYEVMERWNCIPGRWDIRMAPVDSDTYRQWLVDHTEPGSIPPHISFGGCIVPGESDPTFHPRWQARTLAKLASGELV